MSPEGRGNLTLTLAIPPKANGLGSHMGDQSEKERQVEDSQLELISSHV